MSRQRPRSSVFIALVLTGLVLSGCGGRRASGTPDGSTYPDIRPYDGWNQPLDSGPIFDTWPPPPPPPPMDGWLPPPDDGWLPPPPMDGWPPPPPPMDSWPPPPPPTDGWLPPPDGWLPPPDSWLPPPPVDAGPPPPPMDAGPPPPPMDAGPIVDGPSFCSQLCSFVTKCGMFTTTQLPQCLTWCNGLSTSAKKCVTAAYQKGSCSNLKICNTPPPPPPPPPPQICGDICSYLISPCSLLPSNQYWTCFGACMGLPPNKITCAVTAKTKGQCTKIAYCIL
jgi:hypothetical protein